MAEYLKGPYTISTEAARLDLDVIYGYLSRSYWAHNRSKELVARAINNSLCFGVYHDAAQIGLARVITDYATFAYVCDVFILEQHQRQGLGKWLMAIVMAYPDLQGLRRWLLATRDAHGLYRHAGFTPLVAPERWMERFTPDGTS